MIFFFFKQKTAYEMRISDWSSDVCSSDLHVAFPHRVETALPFAPGQIPIPDPGKDQHPERQILQSGTVAFDHRFGRGGECAEHQRSEEHTSELQSLMRISYAAFCLKKKNTCDTPIIPI